MDPFSHPLDAVDDAHQRIRRNCELLERLVEHLAWRGADGEAACVARVIMEFFDGSAEAHHRDEEVDLFAAIEHYVPSRELNATRALLFRLRTDHRKIAALYAQLRPHLVEIAAGRAGALTREFARKFAEAQMRHTELEESELLPLARRVLDKGVLSRMGAAMAYRRKLTQRDRQFAAG